MLYLVGVVANFCDKLPLEKKGATKMRWLLLLPLLMGCVVRPYYSPYGQGGVIIEPDPGLYEDPYSIALRCPEVQQELDYADRAFSGRYYINKNVINIGSGFYLVDLTVGDALEAGVAPIVFEVKVNTYNGSILWCHRYFRP